MSDEPILPSKADESGPELPSRRSETDAPDRVSAPRLPGDESSSRSRLPTRHEGASARSGQAGGKSVARSRTDSQSPEKEDLQALICRLTANKSLGEEVPDGYKFPGQYWKSVQAEDPFTPLLLDPKQHEAITDADVEHHARVVERFWDEKIGYMDQGSGGKIAALYGEKSESKVRGYPQYVQSCKERIRDSEDRRREAEDLLHRRREEAWKGLQPQVRVALQGDAILSSQVASILDAAEEEGIERETARERLHRRFRSEGLEDFSLEDGETRWMKPDEYERRKKELRAAQIPPIRIGPSAAQTIDGLIDLCDEHPEAARKSFYNGYIDQWVGGNYGDTDLANKLAGIRKNTQNHNQQPIGLERALRTLCQHIERSAEPYLTLSHDTINFGLQPFAHRLQQNISVRNASPRRAWGEVRTKGLLPGLTVNDKLDIENDNIRIQLDTTEVEPGEYSGQVVFTEGGTSATHVISISYQIEPVQFSVNPEALHLGALGKKKIQTVTVQTNPISAISYLSAKWANSWDTLSQMSDNEGKEQTPVSASARKSKEEMTIEISLSAKEFKDRKSYKNEIMLALPNGQSAQVPLSFRCPWRHTVLASTVVGSILFGMLFGFTRRTLQIQTQQFEAWMLSPSFEGVTLVIAILFIFTFILISFVPVSLSIWKTKANR